jgi:hypothetical protein
MQTLSEDETKVLISILDQIQFKLQDAAVVLPIKEKLKSGVVQVGLGLETDIKTPPDSTVKDVKPVVS